MTNRGEKAEERNAVSSWRIDAAGGLFEDRASYPEIHHSGRCCEHKAGFDQPGFK